MSGRPVRERALEVLRARIAVGDVLALLGVVLEVEHLVARVRDLVEDVVLRVGRAATCRRRRPSASLSDGLLRDVNHPAYAEFICKHSEISAPESIIHRHKSISSC